VAIRIPGYRKGTSPQLLHPIPPSPDTLVPTGTLGHFLACSPFLITQVSHLKLSGQVVADDRHCRPWLDEYSDTNATERIVQLISWTSRICNLRLAIRPPPPITIYYFASNQGSIQPQIVATGTRWPPASRSLSHSIRPHLPSSTTRMSKSYS
jgi:hypothetical protein